MVRQLIPEGLVDMVPGPELGALLAGIDIHALTGADAVEVLRLGPGSYPMSRLDCWPPWWKAGYVTRTPVLVRWPGWWSRRRMPPMKSVPRWPGPTALLSENTTSPKPWYYGCPRC